MILTDLSTLLITRKMTNPSNPQIENVGKTFIQKHARELNIAKLIVKNGMGKRFVLMMSQLCGQRLSPRGMSMFALARAGVSTRPFNV